MGGKLTLNNV